MLKEILNLASEEPKNIFSGYTKESVPWAHTHEVYKLVRTSVNGKAYPSMYVKEYSTDIKDVERANTEIYVINLLRGSISTPIAESVLISPEGHDRLYLIQEEIPGVPLANYIGNVETNKLKPITQELASVLAQIHKRTFIKFGSLVSGATYDTWRECFSSDASRKLNRMIAVGQLSESQINFFKEQLNNSILDYEHSPTLTHGDFDTRNILVNPNSLMISGLIDFESAKAWIPDWDLTRIAALAFTNRPELLDVFLKTYCKISNLNFKTTLMKIEYYKAFESLHFWTWGWGQSDDLNKEIQLDIERVAGIPESNLIE